MDKPFLGGIVVALAVVLTAGALVMAPRMQAPQTKVAALAAQDTERARRLLHQFSDNEERIAVILRALAETNFESKPEQLDRLLEEEDGRRVLEDEDERLKEVLRESQTRTAPLEERFLQAAYGKDWEAHRESGPRGFSGNVSQMTSAAREGLQQRERLLKQNEGLLNEALQAVESALGHNLGDASGSAEIEPNRLHGVVLYHLAEARRREASLHRRAAAAHLNRLVDLGIQARELVQETRLIESAGLPEKIAEAEARRDEARRELDRITAEAAQFEREIAEKRERMAGLQRTADEARAEMERMELEGARLDHAAGFEQFASRYRELAQRYREALSEIHRLETGTLRNARINGTGDFIGGSYVPADVNAPLTTDEGLPGLERQSTTTKLQVAAAETAVSAADAEVERLKTMESEYRERAASAETRLARTREEAGAAMADFEKSTSAAEALEDEAAKRYARSISAFDAAARAALDSVGNAENAVTTLSEEAKTRTAAATHAQDAWLEHQFKLNAADARIRLGDLHYRVWSDDERIAAALAAVAEPLGLDAAAAEAWRAKAAEAKEAGIEALERAYDSIQNTRGELRGRWTVAAQAAAAANLLALFGQEAMRDIAITTYEGIVADQPNAAFLQAYVERLRLLKTP